MPEIKRSIIIIRGARIVNSDEPPGIALLSLVETLATFSALIGYRKLLNGLGKRVAGFLT